jgi:hypothetical protein
VRTFDRLSSFQLGNVGLILENSGKLQIQIEKPLDDALNKYWLPLALWNSVFSLLSPTDLALCSMVLVFQIVSSHSSGMQELEEIGAEATGLGMHSSDSSSQQGIANVCDCKVLDMTNFFSPIPARMLLLSAASILYNSAKRFRNFVETIDLQVNLRHYDPQRNRRINFDAVLPYAPHRIASICLLGTKVVNCTHICQGMNWQTMRT